MIKKPSKPYPSSWLEQYTGADKDMMPQVSRKPIKLKKRYSQTLREMRPKGYK